MPTENNELNQDLQQNQELQKIENVETTQEMSQKVEVKTEKKKIKNNLMDVEKSILELSNNNGKFPNFNVGDTIRVYVKIIEGDKQRIQPYEGIVIGFRHGGIRRSFIVRRISQNVAIEKIFPYHSPYIEKIEVVKKGKVRRAKLNYLRGKFGRSALVTEKFE